MATTSDVGHQIQVALARVFEIGGRTIEIGASIGVSISPGGEIDTGELIRRADIALYRAKDLGRGVTVEFEDSFDDDTNRQADLEAQLRTTLANGGIVSFQPLINARSGEICGVEALARWVTDSGDRIGCKRRLIERAVTTVKQMRIQTAFSSPSGLRQGRF